MKIYQGLKDNGIDESQEVILAFQYKEAQELIDIVYQCASKPKEIPPLHLRRKAQRLMKTLGFVPCYK